MGDGVTAETYEGVWSDGTNVVPMGVTDIPNPTNYFPGPYVVQWSDAANPRNNFPLVSGPSQISSVTSSPGQAVLTVSNLLGGHSYVEQSNPDLASGNWSNSVNFIPAQSLQSFTNAATAVPVQYWRIFTP